MRVINKVVCVVSIAGAAALLSAQGGLVANAGPDQSGIFVGTVVNLNGAGSSGATTYLWAFTTRPSGSVAVLQNATSVTPSFVPDRRGLYTVRLTVGNGTSTKSDTVSITIENRPPVANAGPDASGLVKGSAALSGAASTDPDNDKLTYKWAAVSMPPASLGVIINATSKTAKLTLDRPGSYVVSLVVRDGLLSSPPDFVTVTTTNSAPVANAGPDRRISIGTQVQLDGTASSDIDEDLLAYAWTLKRPSGSSALLSNSTSPVPTFLADVAGTYTATLAVSDGTLTRTDSVILATAANLRPVSRAGPDDRPLTLGATVRLDGSGSTDAGGQLVSYAWTITKRPVGSAALLSDPTTARPTFTADVAGNYTFNQIITDSAGLTASDARIFSIALPEVNAGPDQDVTVGSTVMLDGSRSRHLSNLKTLAFGWALVSMPEGSNAALDDPADPQPRFVADVEGTYVAQLILFDGTKWSPSDTVVVTTNGNLAPVIDMGPDQLVNVGGAATLDALATDPNQDPLTFTWSLLSRPAGSASVLSASNGASVQITPDVPGDYIVQVTGVDAGGLSSTDTVLLTTGNTSPFVVAEDDRLVATGAPVVADADAGDPDGGPLTYEWRLLRRPVGSAAALDNPASPNPSFTPDVVGAYLVQVVVRDAVNLFSSDAVVYRVPAGVNEPPVANAGSDQTVPVGAVAQLNGSASSDPENQTLTYAWQFASKPSGSVAQLSSETSANPTFTPDVPGEYELELVVNDGVQNSLADSVIVRTPQSLALSPKAQSIAPSTTGPLTVTLAYGSSTDLQVQLQSSNTNIATVPPSVTIPAGETSANFDVTGGTTTGGVMVTASAPEATPAHATLAVGARLVEWNVDMSGSWGVGANWTNNTVPATGDVVVIDRPAGSFTITIGAATPAVGSLFATEQINVNAALTLNGPGAFEGGLNLASNLGGTGNVVIASPMTWTNGGISLGGGIEILSGRTLTFASGPSQHTLTATTLRNHGTVAQGTGNGLTLTGGSTVSVFNEADGVWTMGDDTITSNGAGTLSFTNFGTLRKVSGSGGMLLTGNIAYSNSGTIDIQSGTFTVNDGAFGFSAAMVNSGVLNAAAGTTLNLRAITLAAGTTFSGTGTLVTNGTTTITGNLTVGLPWQFTGGLLTGAGALHINAPMTWNAGIISLTGGIEILSGRTLTFASGASQHVLSATTLRNHGTVAQGTGNGLSLTGNTTVSVINEADGLWTMGDDTITSNGAGTLSFTNFGTLRKVSGSGGMWLTGAIAYSNSGTIDIQSGAFTVGGGGFSATMVNAGVLNAAPGTTLNLAQITLETGTTFSGTGALATNGTTTVNGDLTVGLPWQLTGTLAGTGAIHVSNSMTWNSGSLSLAGGIEVLPAASFSLGAAGSGHTMTTGTSLRNYGAMSWSSGGGITYTGGSITVRNEAGGTWTFGTGAYSVGASGAPNPAGSFTFVNAGTMTGAGFATTTLTIHTSSIGYSNTGSITSLNVMLVP
jgi:hypothetical protein